MIPEVRFALKTMAMENSFQKVLLSFYFCVSRGDRDLGLQQDALLCTLVLLWNYDQQSLFYPSLSLSLSFTSSQRSRNARTGWGH